MNNKNEKHSLRGTQAIMLIVREQSISIKRAIKFPTATVPNLPVTNVMQTAIVLKSKHRYNLSLC